MPSATIEVAEEPLRLLPLHLFPQNLVARLDPCKGSMSETRRVELKMPYAVSVHIYVSKGTAYGITKASDISVTANCTQQSDMEKAL